MILNDPARVGLSNYGRHSRDGLRVDLGDRSVDDGATRVGGRGLTSATALFSSLDLGKTVTQRVDSAPGARLFVKELDDTAGTGWTAK